LLSSAENTVMDPAEVISIPEMSQQLDPPSLRYSLYDGRKARPPIGDPIVRDGLRLFANLPALPTVPEASLRQPVEAQVSLAVFGTFRLLPDSSDCGNSVVAGRLVGALSTSVGRPISR